MAPGPVCAPITGPSADWCSRSTGTRCASRAIRSAVSAGRAATTARSTRRAARSSTVWASASTASARPFHRPAATSALLHGDERPAVQPGGNPMLNPAHSRADLEACRGVEGDDQTAVDAPLRCDASKFERGALSCPARRIEDLETERHRDWSVSRRRAPGSSRPPSRRREPPLDARRRSADMVRTRIPAAPEAASASKEEEKRGGGGSQSPPEQERPRSSPTAPHGPWRCRR